MKRVRLFGPPGTGKTHALLDILERELTAGVAPERIAYLTFTVAARREAVTRVRSRFGYDKLPYFRTLHSIAFRELELSRSCIVRDEIREFAELVGVDVSDSAVGDENASLTLSMSSRPGDKMLAYDHFRRHNMLDLKSAYDAWGEDIDWYMLKHFCDSYVAWKDREGLYDFTDLLEPSRLSPLPVDVVLVDEAQDLSKLQWAALEVFAADAKRMYVAGDDDQAIFAWAGASPEAFLSWRASSSRVLRHSYRIPRAVHHLAGNIIKHVSRRQPKKFDARDADGSVSLVVEPGALEVRPDASTLVLYRNHYLAREVEEELRRRGLPYARYDRPAPGAEWGEAIVMWERLRRGREITWLNVQTIFDAMSRSSRSLAPNAATLLKRADRDQAYDMTAVRELGVLTVEPWFEALTRIDDAEIEYLRRVIQNHGSAALIAPPKITLSTIHAAKGAEADDVVLLTDVSRTVRNKIYERPDDERRVFYVGVTRARENLTLVGVHNPFFS